MPPEMWNYPFHNDRVRSLTLKELYFSSEIDRMVYRADVNYYSGEMCSWETSDIIPSSSFPVLDSDGIRLYGCSYRGICCVDIATGKLLWKSPKFSYSLVYHSTTLGCHGTKSVYTVDCLTGKLVGEVKATAEYIPVRLSEHEYLIRFGRAWHIIVSPSLEEIYTIPGSMIPEKPRFVYKVEDGLLVEYWNKTASWKQGRREIIDLTACKTT